MRNFNFELNGKSSLLSVSLALMYNFGLFCGNFPPLNNNLLPTQMTNLPHEPQNCFLQTYLQHVEQMLSIPPPSVTRNLLYLD